MESPAEMDTNIIFDKFTIDDIRKIEKKTRLDIEKKKEDLRQMVGERYRDLIDAADTITAMKTSAENVMKSVSRMQDHCKTLKQNQMINGVSVCHRVTKDVQKKRNESKFLSIASQIKLLLDTPEKIWTSIDNSEYLKATQLYLLAKHVHSSLQFDPQQSASIHKWFPVMARQWAAISHFRASILQQCRSVLRNSSKSVDVITDSLCAIVLLENNTPRQVFYEFLLARTNAILQLFQLEQQTNSIKTQICAVVQTICKTIRQISVIFYSGNEDTDVNLLIKKLEDATQKGAVEHLLHTEHNSTGGATVLKTIPDFHFALQNAVRISQQQLQERSGEWVDTCKQNVNDGVSRLLSYVTSMKAVTSIRDAIWQQLFQDTTSSDWKIVCEKVMAKNILVWEDFLQPLFVSRCNEILQSQFEGALQTSCQQLDIVLNEISENSRGVDTDMTGFIWSEHSSDIPDGTAWVPSYARTLADGGGLSMKTNAYTPYIQRICKNLDNKLKDLLEDLNYYTSESETIDEHKGERPFDRLADNESLHSFLQIACQSCIKRLMDHLNSLVINYESQMSTSNDSCVKAYMNRVLFCGRLCQAISDLCPNIQKCVIGSVKAADAKSLRRQSSGVQLSKGKLPVEDTRWSSVKELLSEQSLMTYRVWSNYTAKNMITELRNGILDKTIQSLLQYSTKWDEINIEEESESGKNIKSTIRVPMQASHYIHTFLFSLCQEINRIGGHAVKRKVLLDLIEQITDQLLAIYQESLKCDSNEVTAFPFTQTRALQMLFDIRFIANMLPCKDDTRASKEYQQKILQIIDELETYIDPFDLDVFMPYVQSHLTKQTQRSGTLYGSVVGIDKTLTMTGRPTLSNSQEQHSIIQLTNNQSRFSMLPLSTASMTRSLSVPQPKVSQPTVAEGVSIVPSGLFQEVPPKRNDSFYNRLGTIWFSNIGGGANGGK